MSISQMPFVRIIEQPARGGTRFRYECEGRSAGSIPGVNSTPDITTYPAIQVVNYSGTAVAIVSCVTKDFPYRQHPHNLVGERCTNGIAKMIIDNKDMIATFPSMGIQCAKRNDIRVRLKRRQALQVDPFDCGFEHMNSSSFEINLSAVRLCFQVLIEDPKTGQYSIPLQPVVSDVIFDKKSCNELNIIDISSHTISPNGSKLMLFTSFVVRDDIEVRFYEIDDQNSVKWQEFGVIAFIYRHIGISLLTPKYNQAFTHDKIVYLQLKRPSDQEVSTPIKLRMIVNGGVVAETDPRNVDQSPPLIAKISRPSMCTSSLSSSRKRFCANNDSWKEIVLKKPDFPFPILKAAIKREIFINPHKTTKPFESSAQSQCHLDYNSVNKFTTLTDTHLIHRYPFHSRATDFPKPNGDPVNHSFNFPKYKADISFTNSSTTSNQTSLNGQTNEEQNLIIDLTTSNDLTRNGCKSISEDSTSPDSDHHSVNITASNSQRRTAPTDPSDTNDFCCQVNTIEDSEDIEVDIEDNSNDSIE